MMKLLPASVFGLAMILTGAAHATELFVVTRGGQSVVDTFWGSKAACDAVAAESARLACRGLVSKPPAVRAGAYRYDGTDFVRIVNPTAQLRGAALDMNRALTAMQSGFHLLTGTGEATAAELRIARSYVYWARRGAVVVLLRSGYTAARKLEFARSMAGGPAGGTILAQVQQHNLSAPTSPLVWANPGVAGAPTVLLTAAASLSGSEPGNPHLLNLSDAELAGIDVRKDATWIGRLTAVR